MVIIIIIIILYTYMYILRSTLTTIKQSSMTTRVISIFTSMLYWQTRRGLCKHFHCR